MAVGETNSIQAAGSPAVGSMSVDADLYRTPALTPISPEATPSSQHDPPRPPL